MPRRVEKMVERVTARKCSLGELADGSFVVKDGASHLETGRGAVSRANVIAAVVDRPGQAAILLDDGTARVEARSFDDSALFDNLLVGDIVLVIGRPREYQGRKYLVAEIAKRLGSPKWLELRKAEFSKNGRPQAPAIRAPETAARQDAPAARAADARAAPASARQRVPSVPARKETPDEVAETPADKALAVIKRLDTGTGAAIEDVLAEAKCEESTVTSLMAEGEIFEIRPGRVKVLE